MIMLFLTKILFAVVALIVLFFSMFCILRVFDLVSKVNFRKSFDTIEKCPKSMALYYGLRMLGVSIAVGMVVCFCLVL